MKTWVFFAGMVTTIVVLLAGYGLHALQDDIARIQHGRVVSAILQDILNSTVEK